MAVTEERTLRDLGSRYSDVRNRIVDLVADVDQAKEIPVPACPLWSVHDLLSHLTGNCADVMRGNVQGAASDAWTAAQIEERKDASTAAVLAEWAELAPAFESVVDDFPGHFGAMAVADITTHEHDLRSALGRPGARESDEVTLATHFIVTAIVHSGARALGVGPLELRGDGNSWVVGTGEPATGDHDAWLNVLLSGEELPRGLVPVATISAEPFELFRAVGGRRSAEQIRRFDWSTDPEPYIPLFGSSPFTVATSDLQD